jgi:hypothetical protein
LSSRSSVDLCDQQTRTLNQWRFPTVEKSRSYVIRGRVCISRTDQTFIQLRRAVWISANRFHWEYWYPWPAFNQYSHSGGLSLHFAPKHWGQARIGIREAVPCHTGEQLNGCASVRRRWSPRPVRIPIEKIWNAAKFVPWQLPLGMVFARTVHWSQGMSLQWAVIDCRPKFGEHEQLDATLSRVKTRPICAPYSRVTWTTSPFGQRLTWILFRLPRQWHFSTRQ